MWMDVIAQQDLTVLLEVVALQRINALQHAQAILPMLTNVTALPTVNAVLGSVLQTTLV